MRGSCGSRMRSRGTSRLPLAAPAAACALALLLPMAAEAQVRDLLDDLLGRHRGGRIDAAETLSESGSTVVLGVSFSEVDEPEGVELTARVYDVRLRPLPDFVVEPVPIGASEGEVELRLVYAGGETATSASIELRLERGGDLLAREIRPLLRVWSSPSGEPGSGSADQGESLAPEEEDVTAGSAVAVADREPQEVVIDPVPLGDTPVGGGSGGGAPAGGGSSGGSTSGGASGGTTVSGGGRVDIARPGTVVATRPEILARVLTSPTLGYLWADKPTGGRYAPSSGYSYSTANGAMVVARGSAGRYGIQLNGLGSANGPAGGLAVTAYGSGSERCQIQTWNTYSAGLQGTVQCTDAAGRPADSRFTSLALFSLGSSRVAYAVADRPTTASYAPDARYVSSPGGDGVTVTRSTSGSYAVRFPGLFNDSPDRGNVQVTSLGTAGEHCKLTNWTPGAGGALTASVACFAANGQPADARFAVLAVAGSRGSEGMAAYTYANQPGTASYTPLPQLTFARGETQITRSGTGAYGVRFGGLGGSRGGTVQVTAVGAGNAWCKVLNWGAGADAFSANVRCFGGGGQPQDSMFSLLVVR